MSRHYFDPKIATKVGVNAAVLYQNIFHWVQDNAANRRNYYDGRYWTYNTVHAFSELFEYLTPKQVRTALQKLADAELVLRGKYSADIQDHTYWYSLNATNFYNHATKDERNAQMGKPVAPKGNSPDQKGKSYKNKYKPDLKPPSLTNEGQEEDAAFEKVWNQYPNDRRRNKVACQTLFQRLVSQDVTAGLIFSAVSDYAAITEHYSRRTVKYSDNWLKSADWEQYEELLNSDQEARERTFNQSLPRCKTWIENKNALCKHINKEQINALLKANLVTPEMMLSAGIDV